MVTLLGCSAQMSFGQGSREEELLRRIEVLEKRLAQVEAALSARPKAEAASAAPAPKTEAAPPAAPVDVNLMLDGYYSWNANRPAGGVNALRAFDGQHNQFNLSQAVLSLEHAPDVAAGRRFGARVDLLFGQATEALSGNPANEARPAVWRHLQQAYGTWVAPVGRGLTFDFGKWTSTIGYEGLFAKDQVNYTRSLLFTFLPSYHVGARASYDVTRRVGLSYSLLNGIGQSEDFNGARSHQVALRLKPVEAVNWTVNYYDGNENPSGAGTGRTRIVDTYAAWNATPRLMFAGEVDYVHRGESGGGSKHLTGAAGYARYRFGQRFALGARAESLHDSGRLFGEVSQVVREATLTADYMPGGNLMVRWEWRRDWSNRAYFGGERDSRSKHQSTATLGVIWWFGPRTGTW